MSDVQQRISAWCARVLFGPYYTAVVRMDYCDWHGRDSLETILTPFRARNWSSAACKALRRAQREAEIGWIAAHVTDLTEVRQ